MSTIVYVERDEAGAISGIYRHPQPGFAEEELALDHPALAVSGPAWADLRAERNRRLAASDWTQLADAPLDEMARKAWADYRDTLRKLPLATESPADVVWPMPPELIKR